MSYYMKKQINEPVIASHKSTILTNIHAGISEVLSISDQCNHKTVREKKEKKSGAHLHIAGLICLYIAGQ